VTGGPAAADRRIVGTGTSEQDWRRWTGWRTGTPTGLDALVPPGSRLVVMAPHPDDETLGCGGLLHDAHAAGRELLLVAVTAGDASHPGSTRWPVDRLVRQRRAERQSALQCLGIGRQPVVELGLPDGQVSAQELSDGLAAELRDGDVLVVPWRFDGHPDHEATAAGALALRRPGLTLWQVPIWGWHWTGPDDGLLPADPLLYSPSTAGLRAKRQAVAQFSSQLEEDSSTGAPPVLPGWALARWLRRTEVYLGA